jgi:hypothetical protein
VTFTPIAGRLHLVSLSANIEIGFTSIDVVSRRMSKLFYDRKGVLQYGAYVRPAKRHSRTVSPRTAHLSNTNKEQRTNEGDISPTNVDCSYYCVPQPFELFLVPWSIISTFELCLILSETVAHAQEEMSNCTR